MASTNIEYLLAQLDIVEVVGNYVQLKKTGANYTGLCPFHNDHKPSMVISPQKQFFKCFSCGEGGNSIGFIMKYLRLDFAQALTHLSQIYHINMPDYTVKYNQTQDITTSKNEASSILSTLKYSTKIYEQALAKHPDRHSAINYLKNRGLTGYTAKKFHLGFAPNEWNYLSNFSESLDLSQLSKAGLIAQRQTNENESFEDKHKNHNKYYDRFRNRIIFPIADIKGNIIAFGGRTLINDHEPKYLNSPESMIFKKGEVLYGLYQAIERKQNWKRIILVEGYMDVVSLVQSGIEGVVATLGTSITYKHVKLLLRYCDEIVLSFDGDDAGKKAAKKSLEIIVPYLREGVHIKYLILPENEDPDTIIRLNGKEYFLDLIDKSVDIIEFLFQYYPDDPIPNGDIKTSSYIKKISEQIVKIPDPWLQQLCLKRLSNKVSLDVENILYSNNTGGKSNYKRNNYLSKNKKDKRDERNKKNIIQSKNVEINPIRKLIQLIFNYPELAYQADNSLLEQVEKFENKKDAFLFNLLVKEIQKHKEAPHPMYLLGELHENKEASLLIDAIGQNDLTPSDISSTLSAKQFTLIIKQLSDKYKIKQNKEDFSPILSKKTTKELTDQEIEKIEKINKIEK